MKIEQTIARMRELGGEYPETMWDDVSAAYQEDYSVLTGIGETANARVAELEEENKNLKAYLGELVLSGKAEEGAPAPGDNPEGGEGDDEEEAESIDELYH